MYIQIAGKVRAALTPVEEDWGHAPLFVTARGVNTSPIPHQNGVFDIDFDFIDHVLSVRTTEGRVDRIRLEPRTVADFYAELMGILDAAGFAVEIKTIPSDIPDGIPFAEDAVHLSYEPEWANRFWQTLVCIDRVLKEHRSRFRGKTSPVQLWWGSFDLAYSRYSGRLADAQHAAAGFWPGDKRYPRAAFYAYTSPAPDGIETATVEPDAAFWSTEMREFLLPYEAVRTPAGSTTTAASAAQVLPINKNRALVLLKHLVIRASESAVVAKRREELFGSVRSRTQSHRRHRAARSRSGVRRLLLRRYVVTSGGMRGAG